MTQLLARYLAAQRRFRAQCRENQENHDRSSSDWAHNPKSHNPRTRTRLQLALRTKTTPRKRAAWAANKGFKIVKFNFKFPRARTFELFRARSRLYRSKQASKQARPNFASKYSLEALAEIYTMHSFAPSSNLIFFVEFNC